MFFHSQNKEQTTLKAEDLSKSFAARKVVNQVSLTVHKGEVVGLLGPNGAGRQPVFT